MPYQNDMSTLADVVSPAYASMQAGIQNDAANQQQELMNQKAQAQLPYAGPMAQAELEGKQAGTAQTQAQTQGLNLGNLFTQQTQPSKVAATNSENQLKLTTDQAQGLTQVGQIAGQIAGMMDNVPPAARPAAMQQVLKSYGIDNSKIPPELMSGDPDMLRNVSQKMIQASGQFQTQMALEQQKGVNQQGVAQIEGQYHLAGAQATADARKYAADQKRVIDQMKQTVDQGITTLTMRIGSPQEQPDDKARLKVLMEQQAQVKQLQAQNMSQLTGMGVPVSPAINFGGNAGGGGAAPSGPAPDADATKQAATQAFGSYEPDKFIYGINPKNGKFARAPK